MKTNEKRAAKKLNLSRETLRQLDNRELGQVYGGSTVMGCTATGNPTVICKRK